MVQRWQISGNKVGRELASILNGNITDFCDVSAAGVTMKDLSKIPREVTSCIQEIHETRNAQGTQIRIKLYDKLAAANTAAKILELFPKETTINVMMTDLERRLSTGLQRLKSEPIDIEGELVTDGQ
jgi:hypothetical protein